MKLLFTLPLLFFSSFLIAQPALLKEWNADSNYFRKRKIEFLISSISRENEKKTAQFHFDHRGRIREYYGFISDSESEKQVYLLLNEKGEIEYYRGMKYSGYDGKYYDTLASEYIVSGSDVYYSRIHTPIGGWNGEELFAYEYGHTSGDSFLYNVKISFPEKGFQFWELGFEYCYDSVKTKTDSTVSNKSDCENYSLVKEYKTNKLISSFSETYFNCVMPDAWNREGYRSIGFTRTASNFRYRSSQSEKMHWYSSSVVNFENEFRTMDVYFLHTPFSMGTSAKKEIKHYRLFHNGESFQPVLNFDCPLQKWLASSWIIK